MKIQRIGGLLIPYLRAGTSDKQLALRSFFKKIHRASYPTLTACRSAQIAKRTLKGPHDISFYIFLQTS